MSQNEQEIRGLRDRIDDADREIVRLILERARLAKEIGEKKRSGAAPVYRPDREKEVYENIGRIARELFGEELPFPEKILRAVYREIMSGSIAIEGGPGVAYLGPPASFSHLAVRHRFGSSIREVPVDTVPDVFREVEAARDATYGIVPVENSIDGSVTLTLDMFLRFDLKIYAEHYERIQQNLIGPEGIDLADVRKVYTLKIVREQCRDWLQQNLQMSKIEFVDTSSTSAAAAMVAKNRDGVAIASELSAETYGLQVLARGIQDSPNNVTRFLVIGQEQCGSTGDDKTSIVCSVVDRPGSLYEILRPFHEAKINMTKIESRASRRFYGDYNFFIDFHGHRDDPGVQKIMEQLNERTSFLKWLGSYPRIDLP